MNDCILGIKCKGVSMKIDTLDIDSDQEGYDYICNVTLNNDVNGNGTYDVSIVGENYIQGMPIGNWRITKARIGYNWGDSFARFVMTDEVGTETTEIVASEQKGSMSGFSTQILAQSIFPKAQKIVSEYTTAEIYNIVSDFEAMTSDYTWKYIKEESHKNNRDAKGYIDLIEYKVKNLSDYLGKYKNVRNLLKDCEDEKSKLLLSRITEECKKLLQDLG